MKYIIVSIIVFVLLFLYIRGLTIDKKNKANRIKMIKNEYGKNVIKNYSFQGISHRDALIKRYTSDTLLDDITWNDLDMEKIFERIDSCKSAAGEEDLYFRLHNTDNVDEEFLNFINHLENTDDERLELSIMLSDIGFLKKLSFYDYIDYLTNGSTKIPLRDIILDLLFIPSIFLVFFYPILGAICVFILIILNIFLYFKEKKVLDGLLVSLAYIARISKAGVTLTNKNYTFLNSYSDKLKSDMKLLKSIGKSGSYLIASGRNNTGGLSSSSPIEVILNYINMLFHIDLIVYKIMLGKLNGQKNTLEDLIKLFGKIDSAICVASYRKSLKNGYCEPVFEGEDAKNLYIEDGYHPLIKKPVTNSISAQRGILLTGSNASGKSTFLRMVAVNSILAQTIFTVCAKNYKAPVYRIYSSIALTDNLLGGESYFIVEIKSLKRIVDASQCGKPVLCFVDEVLRGTNTIERISASKVILEALNNENVLSFAATHDGELTELLNNVYSNFHFEENVKENNISFDYILRQGPAKSRNALLLLKNMGFAENLLKEAENVAHKLDLKSEKRVY